jgi:hypothetical protein
MSYRARLFVPVLILRASAAKTKTIQHIAFALSEHRTAGTAGIAGTAGMISSEDDVV